MKRYLTKANPRTIDFVLLETEDKFVHKTVGKVGKSNMSHSTINAGSPEEALEEITEEVEILLNKGFTISELPEEIHRESLVFDKAKWHLNEDFPRDLDQNQSYVHTGLFICWLIENGLLANDFKSQYLKEINLLLSRQITPCQFYIDLLDGVFDSEGLTEQAIKFTSYYFDFNEGSYLTDYITTLNPSSHLPSLFHVANNWENYDKLKIVINRRFTEWKSEKGNN